MKFLAALCLAFIPTAFAQQTGKAGEFDYYLLTMSWSPEFCHTKPSAKQCQDHRGFMLHGLWPQFNNGRYPVNCPTTQPPPTDLSKIKQIMPAEIVQHEWQKHGTCSGLSGDEYFALAQKVFESVKIPSDFVAPTKTATMSPTNLKKDFERDNPALADQDIAIQLRQGYLNAVEFCIVKDGSAPTACSHINDVRRGTFKVPPVR